jgi:hypothetical protein
MCPQARLAILRFRRDPDHEELLDLTAKNGGGDFAPALGQILRERYSIFRKLNSDMEHIMCG